MIKARLPVTVFLTAYLLSAGTLAAQPESFEAFFERAQRDSAFRASRIAPGFTLTEELAWEGTGKHTRRAVPCGYQGAEANGWEILPDSSLLAGTGIAYAPADFDGSDSAKVTLGPTEGPADAEHSFQRRDGEWYHAATLVFTSLQPDEDERPVPCGASRDRSGQSSRPVKVAAAPSAAKTTGAPSCASDAIARAKPLLALHFGEDDRISIADEAKELPSIQNPANPKQRFRVFEVWGFIYKGEYRMRFIYHASPVSGCTLMGQEILEYARL